MNKTDKEELHNCLGVIITVIGVACIVVQSLQQHDLFWVFRGAWGWE